MSAAAFGLKIEREVMLMRAKDYLMQIRRIDAEVDALHQQIDKLRMDAQGVRAMALTDMPKGGKGHDVVDTIADVADLQAMCADKMQQLVEMRRNAVNVIVSIDRSELRAVLIMYYLNGKSWEQVADDLNYSMRAIFKLHGTALAEFDKVCSKVQYDL